MCKCSEKWWVNRWDQKESGIKCELLVIEDILALHLSDINQILSPLSSSSRSSVTYINSFTSWVNHFFFVSFSSSSPARRCTFFPLCEGSFCAISLSFLIFIHTWGWYTCSLGHCSSINHGESARRESLSSRERWNKCICMCKMQRWVWWGKKERERESERKREQRMQWKGARKMKTRWIKYSCG